MNTIMKLQIRARFGSFLFRLNIIEAKEKYEKYNSDDIFKNRKSENIQEETLSNNVAMTEYKEPIFKRFINKIKQIFKIS